MLIICSGPVYTYDNELGCWRRRRRNKEIQEGFDIMIFILGNNETIVLYYNYYIIVYRLYLYAYNV